MKSLKSIPFIILVIFIGYAVKAQDNNEEKLNLPGDNLNLYAVMDLFRESETLEGFEKDLNAEDSKINNLDLNNDDKIDYIRVIDNVDGDAHTIVLQVAVNQKENQDVAVFTVQKDNKNLVQVQLIGDEELYGKDYIIEPNYADEASVSTPNPGYIGNTNSVQKEKVVVTKTTYVEVANWPVITYIYVPTYTIWHSPWYWGYYPPYWNPWRPYYWDYYYGYHSHYYNHYYGNYHHSHYYRYPHYNDHYYHGHRSYSNTVYQHRESGIYKNTYSHPETRSQGSADFNKKYPDGYRPSVKPTVSNNEVRPTSKSSARPATTSKEPNAVKPSTRPITTPSSRPDVNKPSTRPATPTPSTKPGSNNSAARPATTSPSAKPATTRPTANPSSTKSDIKKEVHRSSPNIPSAKPNVNKSLDRPSTSSPSTKPASAGPASKPSTTRSSSGTQKSNSSSRSEKPK
jgi:hypothetical protein